MEAQPLSFNPTANPDPRNHAKLQTPCRRKPLPSWRFGLSPVMRRFAIPEIYRRLVSPSRGRADRIGSYRVGRFEDCQTGPEPEVDSWRDVIASEAVLGRLEASKRPGREVTSRRLAMRHRPTQAAWRGKGRSQIPSERSGRIGLGEGVGNWHAGRSRFPHQLDLVRRQAVGLVHQVANLAFQAHRLI